MDNDFRWLLEQMEVSPGASEEAVQSLAEYFQATFHAAIPEDYVEFLRLSNGGIGRGPDLFVIIASAEDVVQKEKGYGQGDAEKDLFLIGGDGCGNRLGIDTRSKDQKAMTFMVFDPIALSNLDDPDAVQARAGSFLALLSNLIDYYARIEQRGAAG